ncbi:MAG: glycosyltransferase [Anaerolineae bacterium]|nr:glycosyltransferase [Anaerolineae bacterium]
MLRVLFLIDTMQMGGAERITAQLLPGFDRIQPLLCTLQPRRDSPLTTQLQAIPRFDLGARRLLDPIAFMRLLQLLRTQQIDLIHAQLQDATIFAALAGRLTGLPVVITRHLIGDDTATPRKRWRNQLEQAAIRWGVTRLICVSDAARDHYAQLTGLPSDRFITIYNGIDLTPYNTPSDRSRLRADLGLDPQALIVTMVGVMRPGKGHEIAIRAAEALPTLHFLLVGDGERRADLEAHAPPNVRFLGQRLDIPQIWRASDIAILPSESEALPTVLIEAGAAALPTIATRVGGIAEVVIDGETGLLIPPKDPAALITAIQTLIQRPDLRLSMGGRAADWVRERFTLDGQRAALSALYAAVSAPKPGSSSG